MAISSCYVVLKYLVVLINTIFWVLGILVLAVAIWQLTDPSMYVGATQDEVSYYSGVYILLAVGLLILLVGILGCCGACNESQCLLVTFFGLLMIVIAAEVAAGIWIYSNKDELGNMVYMNVKKTVEDEYGVIATKTRIFDQIQRELKCCGADGPIDWMNSQYNKKFDKMDFAISAKPVVFVIPPSCCASPEDSPECSIEARQGLGSGFIPPGIYTEGCVDKLNDYLSIYYPWALGSFIGLAVFQLAALVFSVIFCCAVRIVDHYKA